MTKEYFRICANCGVKCWYFADNKCAYCDKEIVSTETIITRDLKAIKRALLKLVGATNETK